MNIYIPNGGVGLIRLVSFIVCVFFITHINAQTVSTKTNPDWDSNNDWTQDAPGYNTERDAILAHDCTINNTDLIVNDYIIVESGVSFVARKTVKVEDGGTLQIDGDMEMQQELVILEGGHLIVCGSLISGMNNNDISNEGMITVCEGGVLEWDGGFDCKSGGTIIVDGTIIIEDEFKNLCDVDGGGEIIVEDGPVENTPPGSFFGCELPADECCVYVDGECHLDDGTIEDTPIHTSVQNGNWTDPATWDVNAVPAIGDDVIIFDSHHVGLSSGAGPIVSNLSIGNASVFLQTGVPLEVLGIYTNNGEHNISRDQLTMSGAGTVISGQGFVTLIGTDDQAGVVMTGDKTVDQGTRITFFGTGTNSGVIIDGTLTNSGEIQMASPVTGSGSWINAELSKLRIFSSFDITLDASAESNTVLYQDIDDQEIAEPINSIYNNLVVGGQGVKTLTSDIIVANSLFIGNASTLDVDPAMNYTIVMQGDWINADGTFIERQGKVIMTGTEDQDVQQSYGIETFYDLEINNVGIGVLLHNDVVVINSLTMTKGDIATQPDEDNSLVLGTGLDNIGTLYYTSGTIYSKFKRWITNATDGVLFPVGDFPNNESLIFKSSEHTLGTLTTQFVPQSPGNEGSPWADEGSQILYLQTFTDGFWNLEAGDGFSSSNFDLTCKIDAMQGFPILGDERILFRGAESQPWKFHGDHGDNNGTYVSRQAMSNFGHFAIAATNDCVVDPPDEIIGSPLVCSGETGVIYTAIALNPGSQSFFWEIVGGEIASGQFSPSITVDWNPGATTGVISVRAIVEDCGLSESIQLEVIFSPLTTSPISGDEVVYENSVSNYSVEPNSGYTYLWTITGGQQIAGGNSHEILVHWGEQGAGVVLVEAVPPSDCPNAELVFLDVVLFETFTSIKSGDWDDPTTWVANLVPTFLSDVLISENHIVMLNIDAVVSNLVVSDFAELRHSTPEGTQITIADQYIVNGEHNATRIIDAIELGSLEPSLIGGSGSINAYHIGINSNEWTLSGDADLTIDATEFIIDDASFLVRGQLNLGDNIQIANAGLFQCSFVGSTVAYISTAPEQDIISPSDSYFNLSIDGGGTKRITDHITVDGNLSVLDGVLASEGQKLTLSGIDIQTVSGSSTIVIDDLEINNRSGLDPGVILSQNLLIHGVLTLTDGVIEVASNKEIRVSATGSNTPGNPLSYVDGRFTREMGSSEIDYIFPVGDGGFYAPAVLNPSAFSSDAKYSAEYFRMGHPIQMTDGTFEVVSPIEYWDITDANGIGADQLRLYYSTGSQIVDPDSALIAHLNESLNVWNQAGTVSSSGSDILGDFIAAAHVSHFSPLTFGLFNNPLPVDLISFTGRLHKREAILDWETATESNNKQFELEHALNGGDFSIIDIQVGRGNSTTRSTYTFTHANLSKGTHYYRLKQVDLDGGFEYSPIVALDLISVQTNAFLLVHPNPSNGGTIQFTMSPRILETDVKLEVYDIRGILVARKTLTAPAGKTTGSINLDAAPGTYILVAATAGDVMRTKFIITEN